MPSFPCHAMHFLSIPCLPIPFLSMSFHSLPFHAIACLHFPFHVYPNKVLDCHTYVISTKKNPSVGDTPTKYFTVEEMIAEPPP
jgi:hypothetical protein